MKNKAEIIVIQPKKKEESCPFERARKFYPDVDSNSCSTDFEPLFNNNVDFSPTAEDLAKRYGTKD